MQCVLHFDVQGARQFIGEETTWGTIDEHFGSGQQRAGAREPDVSLRPQSMVVKAGDFAERIESATMGVAAEVIQWFELAEDGDVDGVAEGLLHFVEGGDVIAQQKRAQCIGAVGEGSHNVIVPTTAIPPDRYYNKSARSWLRLTEKHGTALFNLGGHPNPAIEGHFKSGQR